MSRTLTNSEARQEARKRCGEMAEAKLREVVNNIYGKGKCGLIKRLHEWRFEGIVELFQLSDISAARLLEISDELKKLSKVLDDIIFEVCGIFASPYKADVEKLAEYSEVFIKMAAAKS